MTNGRIISYSLWKEALSFIFAKFEAFPSIDILAKSLKNVFFWTKRFRVLVDYTDDPRNVFSYPEKDLLFVIEKRRLEQFLHALIGFYKKNPELGKKGLIGFFLALIELTFLMVKYIRVGSLDFTAVREDLLTLKPQLVTSIHQFEWNVGVRLMSNLFTLGVINKELEDSVNRLIMKSNVYPHDRDRFLARVIDIWKYTDKVDKEVYMKKMRDFIFRVLRDPQRAYMVPSLAYDLAILRIEDEELWHLILKRLATIDLKDVYLFRRKSLHLAFQYIQMAKPQLLETPSIREKAKELSRFCLELRGIKVDPKQEKIDCCSHEYSRVSEDSSQTQDLQAQESHIQEKMVEESVQKYLIPANPGLKLVRNLGFCSYRIDYALLLPEGEEKVNIALEVTGRVYVLDEGRMIAKKRLKFDLLNKHNWIPVVFNIGTTEMNHIFAHSENESTYKKIANLIVEQVNEELAKTRRATRLKLVEDQDKKGGDSAS
eukprot:TRINITY_DN3999_c0_g1_i3.p1 TRINITY_DN3999_c0_g1~~TRINITY_DN3999_c0_g1_i3.p1  ORF type:complete len:486 (+),score=136.84 TRINITY_DN3999_c0_g1_i3:639-2096(+)